MRPQEGCCTNLSEVIGSYLKSFGCWCFFVCFSSFFLLSFPAGEGGEGKVISVSCVYSDCQEIYTEIKTSWSSFSRAGFCDDSDFQIRKV